MNKYSRAFSPDNPLRKELDAQGWLQSKFVISFKKEPFISQDLNNAVWSSYTKEGCSLCSKVEEIINKAKTLTEKPDEWEYKEIVLIITKKDLSKEKPIPVKELIKQVRAIIDTIESHYNSKTDYPSLFDVVKGDTEDLEKAESNDPVFQLIEEPWIKLKWIQQIMKGKRGDFQGESWPHWAEKHDEIDLKKKIRKYIAEIEEICSSAVGEYYPEIRTIFLYADALGEYEDNKEDWINTFAHELFHAYHHDLGEALDSTNHKHKVVLESCAKYFEDQYSGTDSGRRYMGCDMDICHYAGVVYFEDIRCNQSWYGDKHHLFRRVFRHSLTNPDLAYNDLKVAEALCEGYPLPIKTTSSHTKKTKGITTTMKPDPVQKVKVGGEDMDEEGFKKYLQEQAGLGGGSLIDTPWLVRVCVREAQKKYPGITILTIVSNDSIMRDVLDISSNLNRGNYAYTNALRRYYHFYNKRWLDNEPVGRKRRV